MGSIEWYITLLSEVRRTGEHVVGIKKMEGVLYRATLLDILVLDQDLLDLESI